MVWRVAGPITFLARDGMIISGFDPKGAPLTASTQGFPASSLRDAVLRFALVGLAVVAVGGFLAWFFACPCDRIPGGYLFGKVIEKPVNDWSFANQVSLCQIQLMFFILHLFRLE